MELKKDWYFNYVINEKEQEKIRKTMLEDHAYLKWLINALQTYGYFDSESALRIVDQYNLNKLGIFFNILVDYANRNYIPSTLVDGVESYTIDYEGIKIVIGCLLANKRYIVDMTMEEDTPVIDYKELTIENVKRLDSEMDRELELLKSHINHLIVAGVSPVLIKDTVNESLSRENVLEVKKLMKN